MLAAHKARYTTVLVLIVSENVMIRWNRETLPNMATRIMEPPRVMAMNAMMDEGLMWMSWAMFR